MDSNRYLQFKSRQFDEYKKSPKFEAQMANLGERSNRDGRSREDFLFRFETDYMSKYVLDFCTTIFGYYGTDRYCGRSGTALMLHVDVEMVEGLNTVRGTTRLDMPRNVARHYQQM